MTQSGEPLFHQGPHLAAAVLCEKVLVEGDGVASIIRMIDRLNRTAAGADPPAEMEPFDYQFYLYVSFKAGSARGTMPLEVRVQKPSGSSSPPFHSTLNFEGDDERGVSAITDLRLRVDTPGLYWVDIYLDHQRVTRIPLRVVYLPQIRQTSGPTGPASAE